MQTSAPCFKSNASASPGVSILTSAALALFPLQPLSLVSIISRLRKSLLTHGLDSMPALVNQFSKEQHEWVFRSSDWIKLQSPYHSSVYLIFFSGSILPSNCPPVSFTLYILFPPSQFVPQMHVSFLSLSLSNRRDFFFNGSWETEKEREREKNSDWFFGKCLPWQGLRLTGAGCQELNLHLPFGGRHSVTCAITSVSQDLCRPETRVTS